MEENKNRHLRPKRNVESIKQGAPVNKTDAQGSAPHRPSPARNVGAPKPAQSATPKPAQPAMPKPAQPATPKPAQPATPKPAQPATPKPAQPATPKPAQPAPKVEVEIDSTPTGEYEKTKMTDVTPKSKFKTPIGKNTDDDDDDKIPSALGGIFKALLYMVSVILVSVVIAYFVIQFGNDVFAFVKSDEVKEVVIPEDATFGDVAKILGENDVIEYPFLFKLYAIFSGDKEVDEDGNSVFIPGTYEVSPMKNYMQLLAYFQKQPKVREVVWVTFPEGSTVDEMITVLVDDYGIASREEFKSAINDYDYDLEFLEGIDELEGRYYRLEGYLFPDTYQFYTDSTAETVIYKMLVNFEDKLEFLAYGDTTYLDRLEELGMTLDQVVTLASIIEEEVKYPIDYDQVSSVFHNRLANKANFPTLGSDATTVYAITMETGERPQTLGAAELAFDSPYNTRKSAGLTPGAIANPGFEALYSAFYPANTKYYYFVADNNGYNLYARTEAAHERNKASIKKDN